MPATTRDEDDPYERVSDYLEMLTGFFTGSGMDDGAYAAMRTDLLDNPDYRSLAPTFLRRNRTTRALWSFAKSVDPSWEPRRAFLREQFEPLLAMLETTGPARTRSMPGPYDAEAWIGLQSGKERVRAIRTLIPVARAAVEVLIAQLEAPTHNGGPPLDEVAQAVQHLRHLHRALGEILTLAETGELPSERGEGLVTEAARYGRRAAKALRNDPMPYAVSASVLAILSTCGFPDTAGYLGAIALTITKSLDRS